MEILDLNFSILFFRSEIVDPDQKILKYLS